MKGRAFTAGTTIWIGGRAAKILDAATLSSARVEFIPSGEVQTIDLSTAFANATVAWTPPNTRTADEIALESIPEYMLITARDREAMIAPLKHAACIESAVAEIVRASGRSKRTIYTWKRDYDMRGLRGLVPGFRSRGGKGRTRLPPEHEELLTRVIEREYMKRTKPTQQRTYEHVIAAFQQAGLPVPARRTFRARIKAMDPWTTTAAREGTKRARNRHMVSAGNFPSQVPLQTILIDHTVLDLQLVDADRRPIGRPFLTLAMDAATRLVYGYYLSLDPPSYLSVAMCILQGVFPKDDTVRKLDLKQPWPIYGLPHSIHTDNGKDFRSTSFERFADQYGIELQFRPVRVPHYGGFIERVIGTINRYTHSLPGTTRSSVVDKGDYDSEKTAIFTIDEAEQFVARRIVEHYHCSVHSELGKTPKDAWNEAIAAGLAPAVPDNPGQFRIDVLPSIERTVQKDGISLFDLRYTDGVLQHWRSGGAKSTAQKRFVVKYDPRNISSVYFVDADGRTHPIPLARRDIGPISLMEYRACQRRARESGTPLTDANLADMLERERRQTETAAAETKRARRTQARSRGHGAVGGITAGSARSINAKDVASTVTPRKESKPAAIDWTVKGLKDSGFGLPVLNYAGK